MFKTISMIMMIVALMMISTSAMAMNININGRKYPAKIFEVSFGGAILVTDIDDPNGVTSFQIVRALPNQKIIVEFGNNFKSVNLLDPGLIGKVYTVVDGVMGITLESTTDIKLFLTGMADYIAKTLGIEEQSKECVEIILEAFQKCKKILNRALEKNFSTESDKDAIQGLADDIRNNLENGYVSKECFNGQCPIN